MVPPSGHSDAVIMKNVTLRLLCPSCGRKRGHHIAVREHNTAVPHEMVDRICQTCGTWAYIEMPPHLMVTDGKMYHTLLHLPKNMGWRFAGHPNEGEMATWFRRNIRPQMTEKEQFDLELASLTRLVQMDLSPLAR